MTGAGSFNHMKHVLRAYFAKDWSELQMLADHYSNIGKMHDVVIGYFQNKNKRRRYDKIFAHA